MALIFVDCEADFNSPCPGIGSGMTEFGAVEFMSRKTFHGKPTTMLQISSQPRGFWLTMVEFDKWIQQFEPPYIFISDNPGYDWQWINYWFHKSIKRNPFGHSSRRIGDFYAGLVGNFRAGSKWKKYRVTKHDHNPVNDAMGNCEAFAKILELHKDKL